MSFKLGVLVCDHINEKLRDEFISYPTMFEQLFEQIDGDFEVQYYFVIEDEFPKDINECEAYMTSGSQYGVNDELPWIKKLIELVQELYKAEQYFVGICFGHQLMAKALGGKVEKSDKGWGVGVHSSKIISTQSWLNKKVQNLDLIVSHQDQISQLPENSHVIASNEFCPYSMIQVGEKFIGIQGHPEFTHDYSQALMDVRKDRIPSTVLMDGKSSLKRKTNNLEITQQLINFIRN